MWRGQKQGGSAHKECRRIIQGWNWEDQTLVWFDLQSIKDAKGKTLAYPPQRADHEGPQVGGAEDLLAKLMDTENVLLMIWKDKESPGNHWLLSQNLVPGKIVVQVLMKASSF